MTSFSSACGEVAMPFQPNFGVLGDPAVPAEPPILETPFRIAVLGDFSGRGQRGEKTTSDALASRKPCKVNRNNLDDSMATLKVRVKIPDLDGEAFERTFAGLDDFHPDQIHETVDRFAFLSDDDD